MTRLFYFILLLVALMGCEQQVSEEKPGDFSSLPSLEPEIALARENMAPAALDYLEAALDTIQVLHPSGNQFDWEEWRLASLDRARNSKTYADTYPSLTQAIFELPGQHGFFQKPDSTLGLWPSPPSDPEALLQQALDMVYAEHRDTQVGLVRMGMFLPHDLRTSNAFATLLLRQIQQVEATGTCGWIVDLRRNTGGNMWPMLAGLSPFLGEGMIGSFVDRQGKHTPWYLEDGVARLDSLVLADVGGVLSKHSIDVPVAVLIGNPTGSSGEAAAVALQGLPNTRFFGEPTAGATSSPMRLRLRDGVVIGFAATFFADREGTVYSEPIVPDELVDYDMMGDSDLPMEVAEQWVLDQADCRIK